jgi:transcriptional regulator with XRE-family HTH domain
MNVLKVSMSPKTRKTKGTATSVDMHVGQRLRVRRSLLGLSQEKLAEYIGVTFQQIRKYERGMNRISAGRLFQLSKILEVPVAYFFENAGNAADAQPSRGFSDNSQEAFGNRNEDLMMNKETLELIRVYYAIESSERRKNILKFIKSMAPNPKEEQ